MSSFVLVYFRYVGLFCNGMCYVWYFILIGRCCVLWFRFRLF